jgi:hypothetical protein
MRANAICCKALSSLHFMDAVVVAEEAAGVHAACGGASDDAGDKMGPAGVVDAVAAEAEPATM